MEIVFKEYKIIHGERTGLSLVFDIDGNKYTRCSILEPNHKQLLFWKVNDERYLNEEDSFDLENKIKVFFTGNDYIPKQILNDARL